MFAPLCVFLERMMTAMYSSPAFIPPHLHEESDRDDTLISISGAFHNSTQGDRGKIVAGT